MRHRSDERDERCRVVGGHHAHVGEQIIVGDAEDDPLADPSLRGVGRLAEECDRLDLDRPSLLPCEGVGPRGASAFDLDRDAELRGLVLLAGVLELRVRIARPHDDVARVGREVSRSELVRPALHVTEEHEGAAGLDPPHHVRLRLVLERDLLHVDDDDGHGVIALVTFADRHRRQRRPERAHLEAVPCEHDDRELVARRIGASTWRGAAGGKGGDREHEQRARRHTHDRLCAGGDAREALVGRRRSTELHLVDLADDLAERRSRRLFLASPHVLAVRPVPSDPDGAAPIERGERCGEIEAERLLQLAACSMLLGEPESGLGVRDLLREDRRFRDDERAIGRVRCRCRELSIAPPFQERADHRDRDHDHDPEDEQVEEPLRHRTEPLGHALEPALLLRYVTHVARLGEALTPFDLGCERAELSLADAERAGWVLAEGVAPLVVGSLLRAIDCIDAVCGRDRSGLVRGPCGERRRQAGDRDRDGRKPCLHAASDALASSSARAAMAAKRVWMSQPSARVRMLR